MAHLPTLKINGTTDPLVKIIDEGTGKWVYCLRIKGTSFRPKVFKLGFYTIEVGEGATKKVLSGVKANRLDESGIRIVSF